MKKFWRTMKLKLFHLKYKIKFIIDIKFKRWNVEYTTKIKCGKTNLIYELAMKYHLPVLTQFEELYKGCNVINPATDSVERLCSFKDKVILVDAVHSMNLIETVYVLSGRNNILVGFESEVRFYGFGD